MGADYRVERNEESDDGGILSIEIENEQVLHS